LATSSIVPTAVALINNGMIAFVTRLVVDWSPCRILLRIALFAMAKPAGGT
jgi:hypothetical protein